MNRALQSILRGAVLLVLVTVTATAAPIITATKDDNLAAGLRKLPGNTITYTITIGNTGDATATAVQFTDPDPANTSFVSVGTTPIARNDTFSAIGNVQISIAAPGLLANDNDADGDALTVSGVNTAGTQGNVTFNANGSFTFNPAPGFEGATTFTYTVNDGNGHTDTATVTINVAGMVWFINAAAGAGGDGRVATPFNTIASYLASAPTKDTGDNIFLYTGTYSTGLALGTNQRLIGQGALTSLQAITGLTPPTGSSAFPATGGTRPTIAVASGTGVTLGSGNTVNGLNVTNSNGSGITGSAVGTLTLADFGVTVTGGTALSLTTSGTVTATGANNTLTSTNNTALNLASVAIGAGGMTLKSVASTSAANGISLVSLGGGALTVTGDGSGFANGSGGSISNATTEAVRMLTNSGTITFRSMNFSMNTSAIDGILVDNNAGGTIVVNVTGCTFTGVTASVSQNKSLLQFEGGGASNVTANVQNTFFNSSRTYGCFATAAGTSVMNVTVNQCGFGTDVNTGAPVNQPGTTITNPPAFSLGVTNSSSALVDYTITNNTFWGADGTLGAIYAVTISGASTTASAHLNGSFNFNKIGKTGVTGSGAANGSAGLGLLPGTLGQFYATVIGNDIRQVNTFGVNFFNSVTAGNTDATLKIKGNTFAEPDTTGAPPFLRAIVVSPGNSGGANNPWKAEIGDTTGTVPANKNNISGAWQAGFFIRVTNNNNTSALTLPGLTPTSGATAAQVNTFVQNANTLPASSVGSALGTAGIIGGGPLPLIFAPGGVDAKSSLAANVSGRVGVPPAVAGVSLETSDHSNAIHVSSISKASREVRDAAGATPSRSPGIVRALTQAELDSLVAAALDRWTATGLTGEQLATLSNLKFEVADLPGWYLGEADGNRIRVDNDAGGHGWFIGAGPESDALFGNTGFQPVRPAGILPAGGHADEPTAEQAGSPLSAPAGSLCSTRRYAESADAPAGRIDLLTTVLHEMGHALGLDDTYAEPDRDSLMYGFLTKGERRLPAKNQAAGAVPRADGVTHFLGTPLNIGDLPAGKSVTITYVVTISAAVPSITNQGTVSGGNFASVLTDDPTVAGAANPTVTPVELPPTVSNANKGVNEDVATAFAAVDFTPVAYSDPNGDALATVRITSLPANGVLKNGATTISTVPTDIAIASIGNLTYTSNLNYNGPDSFGWNGSDGTLFATTGATVNVTVNAVNDKPTFTAANPPAVNKNVGAQTVVGWVTGFNPGPPDESTQTVLGYAVSSVGTPALFSVQPAVATNGTLTYTPSGTTSGTSTFQVRVQDSGGTAFGGIDLSDAQTFTITVNANSNPVANPDTIVRYPSQSVKVLISTMLSNDTDADSNPLGLTAVGSPLPVGATLTQDSTWVYYTPPTGSTSAGSFTYSISDGQGGTANGAVTVNIIVDNSTAQNITKIETLGDGSKRVTFGGIPGRTYRVQSTDSLAPANWVDRATVPADALGQFQFTDPPPLPPTRFYRSVSP